MKISNIILVIFFVFIKICICTFPKECTFPFYNSKEGYNFTYCYYYVRAKDSPYATSLVCNNKPSSGLITIKDFFGLNDL